MNKINPQDIDLKYIRRAMSSLGITAADIVEDSGIDKSSISLILNKQRKLTKWHKFAFFYYFKSLV